MQAYPTPPVSSVDKTRQTNPAFSLLELLLTISIVAVLALLGWAVLRDARATAQQAKCSGNLRNIGAATAEYLADHQGALPFALQVPTHNDGYRGSVVGAWYWNLAPYLGIPRSDINRKTLGETGGKIQAPIVFTCPGHSEEEPNPITFPSTAPVSYAPSGRMVPREPTHSSPDAAIYRYNLKEFARPSQKIWVSDSDLPNMMNISATRWTVGPTREGSPLQKALSRHSGAANALFFDGHVEKIPYDSIVANHRPANVSRLFDPVAD